MPERSGADGARASLRLLGGWQLLVGGVDLPLRHREQRLTALLGLTGRTTRAHVAGTLWPESTDARALASLRRAVLQTQQCSPGLVRADRTDIGLAPDVEVDVDDVRRAAALTELPMPGDEAEALLAALVGEPLLPAWYDDWVLPEREHVERLRVRALERIARHAFGMGDLVQAVDAAGAALDIEPLLESARELTIRAHLARGDRGSALREFHRYRDAMRDELGVAPSATILALVGPAGAPDARAAAPPSHRAPLRPAPAVPRPEPPAVGPPVAPPVGPRIARPVEEPATTGAGRVGVRLVAAAAVVLAASVAVAGSGLGSGRGDPDARGSTSPPTGDVPAPSPLDPSTRSRSPDGSPQAREVMVRPADAAVGSAALVVRATRRPATVRLVMRGPAGSVVRSAVVRSQDGRRLVMDGLDPGTYRWLVTSPTAAPVSGRVRVADRAPSAASTPEAITPVATPAPTPVVPAPDPTTRPAPSSPTPQASPSSPPTRPAQPAPQPTRQPTRQPTPQPAPQPTRQPTPSQQPSPAGDPTDPGTVDPTPVG